MRESGVRCPECGARVRDADQQLYDETTIRQLQRVVEAWKERISARALAGAIVRALGAVYGDTEDISVDDDDVKTAELVLAWLRALPVEMP